jgi:hypothetical protein
MFVLSPGRNARVCWVLVLTGNESSNVAAIMGDCSGLTTMQVRFEELIASPQKTLNKLGGFIGQELDHYRIRQVAYGSVSRRNTSFKTESPGPGFSPVGRWKKGFSPAELLRFERMLGKTLKGLFTSYQWMIPLYNF